MEAMKGCELARYDLPEVVVPPLGSTNVVFRRLGPGCYFRPASFCIPDDVTADLFITDVKVGRNSQLYSVGGIPAGLFAESAPEARMSMDHLSSGMSITLSITNTSHFPIAFRGQVLGVVSSKADNLPGLRDGTVVMGLGSILVEKKATINVEAQIDIVPHRLYVPPSLLDDFEIESFSSEVYLNDKSSSQVPTSQLERENLVSEGLVDLAPNPVVMAQTFFTIAVVNRSKEPRNFCGAILAMRA